MTKKLSIIVPCYCEEESIPLFYDAVEKVAPQLPNIELEYWFIDDGSSDNTLGELRKMFTMPHFHGILEKKPASTADYNKQRGIMLR